MDCWIILQFRGGDCAGADFRCFHFSSDVACCVAVTECRIAVTEYCVAVTAYHCGYDASH